MALSLFLTFFVARLAVALQITTYTFSLIKLTIVALKNTRLRKKTLSGIFPDYWTLLFNRLVQQAKIFFDFAFFELSHLL